MRACAEWNLWPPQPTISPSQKVVIGAFACGTCDAVMLPAT